MKKLFSVFILSSIIGVGFSQKQSVLFQMVNNQQKAGIIFKNTNFFKPATMAAGQQKLDSLIKDAAILTIGYTASTATFKDKPSAISLTLPYAANRQFTLHLAEQKINSADDFSFGQITSEGARIKTSSTQGLHYRGYVQGDANSLACISIFSNGEVMGLFSNSEGNFVLGKITGSNAYILYNDKNFVPLKMDCAAEQAVIPGNNLKDISSIAPVPLSVPPMLCKKVKFYWEADYGMYRYRFGSNLPAVQNYITGLFNQFAAMYQNEGITVELAESYVWTFMDPYRTNSSLNALNDFRERWNLLGDNFNGNLAHLLSSAQGYNNGGIAFREALCIPGYGYGYSNIYTFYDNIPVYSWDVEVTVHEVGHNLGSMHTQWCGWNTSAGGSCGAIDDCYTLETENSCSTCPATTQIATRPPGWQGTIMSYCHLVNGVGINLSNGFGPLPQTVIRDFVSSANCITRQNLWTGEASTSWSNAANWNCGSIPDAGTDVIINTGVPNFPIVTSAAVCRSLRLNIGSSLRVNTGFNLLAAGAAVINSTVVQTPYTNILYITGTATQGGWMIGGDVALPLQKLNRITNTIYEINSVWLNGGGEFLFVPQYGNWNDKYGYPGTRLTNFTEGDVLISGGEDFKAPPSSGFYRIIVNFETGRYFIAPAAYPRITVPPSSQLFITGNATAGGWMADGATPLTSQQFTQISTTIYEIASIPLIANGSYLFVPVYGNWNAKYGGVGDDNTNTVVSDFFQGRGSNLLAPPVSGNYKVTVDFQRAVFTLTRLL